MTQYAGQEDEQPGTADATLEARFAALMQRFWRTLPAATQPVAGQPVDPIDKGEP